jgi:tetratricopeptide (TPR) repeat protein
MAANHTITPKDYPGDAENTAQQSEQTHSVYGLIKLFLQNVHTCTVVIRCKIISGTVEMSHCSNVVLKMEKEATVATLQMDLCKNVDIQYHDAPSGKSTGHPKTYWGEDANDRIFHAGVNNMKLSLYRDGFVDMETTADYIKDGATEVGNATAEEMQFVTSVVDGQLHTERVVRHGGSTGKSARAMTQRELDAEKEKREKAVDMAMEKAIRFEEKGEARKAESTKVEEEEEIEEVFTSMSKSEIKEVVAECEAIKVRGNEAFAAGEYAQAVLFYSLALDKADELPDKEVGTQLYARHIVLANRSAAFLKLGEHEKALADGKRAEELDPTYVKGVFRKGLALHAMGRYLEAIQALAAAHKLEPLNKQVKQALMFSERRLQEEMRQRRDS